MARLVLLLGLLSWPLAAQEGPATAYPFSFAPLTGTAALPLADYAGHVILVVNTASNCGFTPQYEGLEALYQKYRGRGLVVVGVPSNDFGAQEPGSNRQIAAFCRDNYGVTFPMAAKTAVSGPAAHPFYTWARRTLGEAAAPQWNFHKYLIDRRGRLVAWFDSGVGPLSARLKAQVESLLAQGGS